MQDSTDAGARPIILYIIIAIALFVALILGVRFAKGRAAYYSQPQTGQNQQTAQTDQPQGSSEEKEPAPATPPSQPASNSNESQPTAPAPSTANTPVVAAAGGASRVPSTGPEQVYLPIISLSAVVFAALSYAKARRRFQNMALEA